MIPLVDAVIEHGLGARYSDLPQPARSSVQTFLLDSLGVGIAGAAHPLTPDVRRAALGWGGPGPARLWGVPGSGVTPATAAFVNAFQIHCQEFDCVHEPAVVHPMATVLAAVMADVDAAPGPVPGEALCMALAVGVDLAAGLGVAARSPIKFFRPANAGLFGAVLALSRLRRFSHQQARDALGYALAFNAGTMQAHVEGKPALPLQIANAARCAVAAADLAGLGVPGPQDSLEGPFGYFRLFEDAADPSVLRGGLGRVWRIAQVSHKPFPTGRACQGGIELMMMLAPRIGSVRDIAEVRLTAPPLIGRLVGRPWQADMTSSYARLCFAYCGATALRSGGVGLEDFRPGRLVDEATGQLARRISVWTDDGVDPAAFTPQQAEIRLNSGEILTAATAALVGSPDKPLTALENEAKFRACAAFGFAGPSGALADALISGVSRIGTLRDCSVLSILASGQEPTA